MSTQLAENRPPVIPNDVLSTPPSNGRFGFLVNGELSLIVEGSDGLLYERDGEQIKLITRRIPEAGLDYED